MTSSAPPPPASGGKSERPAGAPPAEGQGAPAPPGPGDILVVDDNPANLLAIEAALGDLAVGMQRAQSGSEALRLLLERDFAVILLDVNMPSLDGYETARLIRERKRSRHTPIIFVTAYSRDDREVLKAYELGAVDFLFKPIVPEVLRAKTAVFVELARRSAEVARQAEQLRDNERQLHEQRMDEERRRWEEESLRKQRDDAQRAAELLTLKAEELAATIDEKEQIERALIRSNQELAAADRRKDEFLAVLGHELRNPLAPLVAGLEIMKRGIRDPGASEDPIGRDRLGRTRDAMDRQVRYLARLVDDLLDVSRINSGKIELRRTTVHLQEIIDQAVAAVRPALDERQHELRLTQPTQPVLLVADGVRVTQVLANLLNNAVRYTEPGGVITLRAEVLPADKEQEARVRVQVTDTGRGIPPELLPRIFGMFVQEQAGGGGLGLGLTLVDRLVTLHGGTVAAASEGAGRGATFTVELPVGAPTEVPIASSARADAAASNRNGKAAGHGAPHSNPDPAGAASGPTSAATASERPLAIALVDDNPDIRETMYELLTTWGHSVETAYDGPSGVELILRTRPDLAFVDIGLPKLDGYGVASQVRAQLGNDRVRLVAMSGFGQEADRRKSLEVGFNAHLVKPADIDAILNVISPLPDPVT